MDEISPGLVVISWSTRTLAQCSWTGRLAHHSGSSTLYCVAGGRGDDDDDCSVWAVVSERSSWTCCECSTPMALDCRWARLQPNSIFWVMKTKPPLLVRTVLPFGTWVPGTCTEVVVEHGGEGTMMVANGFSLVDPRRELPCHHIRFLPLHHSHRIVSRHPWRPRCESPRWQVPLVGRCDGMVGWFRVLPGWWDVSLHGQLGVALHAR